MLSGKTGIRKRLLVVFPTTVAKHMRTSYQL